MCKAKEYMFYCVECNQMGYAEAHAHKKAHTGNQRQWQICIEFGFYLKEGNFLIAFKFVAKISSKFAYAAFTCSFEKKHPWQAKLHQNLTCKRVSFLHNLRKQILARCLYALVN